MALEFSQTGVLEFVQFLNQLQLIAVKQSTSSRSDICMTLHGMVAGLLHLVSKIISAPGLQDHIQQVLMQRKSSAPFLLPEVVFCAKDGADGHVEVHHERVQDQFLFTLEEGLLTPQQDTEPKKTFGK